MILKMNYELRKPKATDIFVVSKIIKGIGLKNIADCFNSDEIKVIRNSVSGEKVSSETLNQAGITIVLSIGDLVLEKMEFVQNDLIKFISNLTGLKVKEVEDLPITDFAEIVMAIIKEPDFVDFIKVVLKSFN